MIQINNLTKNYIQGSNTISVLDHIDMNIKAGESVAIVGPSGSGKTTFLSLLAGLDKSDSGEILFDGKNICQLPESGLVHYRSFEVSIIFQQFHLLNYLTALENVSLPLEIQGNRNAKNEAKEYLQKVGLKDRSSHLPHQLSGGENQRVAIARALATQPKAILADEPSGNLDQETGQKVMDLLFKMVNEQKTTLILVTHNPELAKRCNSIYELHHGKFHIKN